MKYLGYIGYIFLFLGSIWSFLILFFLFQNIYTFYGFPWDYTALYISSLVTLCIFWICMYFAFKKVPKKLLGTMVWVFVVLFWIYLFLYINIPLDENIQNNLEYKDSENDDVLSQRTLDIIKQATLLISSDISQEEKEAYLSEFVTQLIENESQRDVYFANHPVIREWFFYDREQFLAYKQQEWEKIKADLNYETTDFYDSETPSSVWKDFIEQNFYFSWKYLLSREYVYQILWGNVNFVKAQKNHFLDMLGEK